MIRCYTSESIKGHLRKETSLPQTQRNQKYIGRGTRIYGPERAQDPSEKVMYAIKEPTRITMRFDEIGMREAGQKYTKSKVILEKIDVFFFSASLVSHVKIVSKKLEL